jgi:hypothetical protein
MVVIAGGFGGGCSCILGSAELYDPATGTLTATADMSVGRYDHTATMLPSGNVLIVGGISDSGPSAAAELYNE